MDTHWHWIGGAPARFSLQRTANLADLSKKIAKLYKFPETAICPVRSGPAFCRLSGVEVGCGLSICDPLSRFGEQGPVEFVDMADRLEGFEHRLADQPPAAGIAMADGIPEAHRGPDLRVMPFRHAENRVEAHPPKRHALPEEQLRILCHFVQPAGPVVSNVARLRDHDLAAIAPPHGAHEIAERPAARVTVGEGRDRAVCPGCDAPLPLIGPIVVDADDIQVRATAAEFRQQSPAQHVPALEDEALVEVT